MAILKPYDWKPGEVHTFALRYKAREWNGNFGKQFQYFFVGGDTAYFPPIAHQEIESLHLDTGDKFTILKTQDKGQVIKWTAERVPQPKPIERATVVTRETPEISGNYRETPVTRIDAPSLTTPQSSHLFKQLVATIEAVKAAEEFAKQINRPVVFTEADIRAMAISGFIEQARRAA